MPPNEKNKWYLQKYNKWMKIWGWRRSKRMRQGLMVIYDKGKWFCKWKFQQVGFTPREAKRNISHWLGCLSAYNNKRDVSFEDTNMLLWRKQNTANRSTGASAAQKKHDSCLSRFSQFLFPRAQRAQENSFWFVFLLRFPLVENEIKVSIFHFQWWKRWFLCKWNCSNAFVILFPLELLNAFSIVQSASNQIT